MSEYIEREALKKSIREKANPDGCMHIIPRDVYLSALSVVECEPAADVAEVKHGKWIQKEHLVPLAWDCAPSNYDSYDEETHSEKEKYWHCNRCDYEGSRSIRPIYNFCPNCGAKMDLGGN